MPGTVLGSADTSVSKPVQDICPYRASILVEKLDNKQIKNSCQVVIGKEKPSRIRWWRKVAIFGRVVKEDVINKVTFEQRLERS